ncbi:MAG: VOC family protein [Gemmatimonadota bacterium]|nr:VOC family protein [Gemmatimonadota bacterium]
MTDAWKPDGYTSVSPYLVTRDAQRVIDFLVAVLDAEPLRRYDRPDGSIMHAELRIDDTVVMIGEATDETTVVPCHLHVYVPDVDAAYERALARGAESVSPPTRKEGESDRRGGVVDPAGNSWWFSTQLEE